VEKIMIQTKAPFFGENEPAWDIALLYPSQGEWSEEEYLALNSNRLVEFSHGCVEVLAMPTPYHQSLVLVLCTMLRDFVRAGKLGTVLFAPLPIQLWPGKFREPDIVFMRAEHNHRRTKTYWIGADLVIEIISPDDRARDTVRKRREYAQAGIPEYWLVDPAARTITVLVLAGNQYGEHGTFVTGSQATSPLLPGFLVDVSTLFAEAEG
jgi:Uma2 family endonuclease